MCRFGSIVRHRSCVLPLAALTAGMLLPTPGCSSNTAPMERESSNLKPLSVLYGRYLGQHRGKPPASEQEFKQFIRAQGEPALQSLGVTDVDAVFVSRRDKQPFVVLYGGKGSANGPGGAPIIAYEREGVDGDRFVASELGAIEEMDEASLRKLVPSL